MFHGWGAMGRGGAHSITDPCENAPVQDTLKIPEGSAEADTGPTRKPDFSLCLILLPPPSFHRCWSPGYVLINILTPFQWLPPGEANLRHYILPRQKQPSLQIQHGKFIFLFKSVFLKAKVSNQDWKLSKKPRQRFISQLSSCSVLTSSLPSNKYHHPKF